MNFNIALAFANFKIFGYGTNYNNEHAQFCVLPEISQALLATEL